MKINKFLLISLISIGIFLTSTVNTSAAGLVPCGPGTDKPNCQFCDLLTLFQGLISFGVMIIFPIATIMIIIGGFYIMTARENPGQSQKGRQIITTAVIGILIALLSWIVLDTIFKVLATNWSETKLGPWNQINCQ